MGMTLTEALENHAREKPSAVAIVHRDRNVTFGELNETANRLASSLRELGLKKGDGVGLAMPRIPELVSGFLGVVKAQGMIAPIDYEMPADRIGGLMESLSMHYVITHSSLVETLAKAAPAGLNTRFIVIGDDSDEHLSWDGLLASGTADNPEVNIVEEDVVYLNFTSGSTGIPKGAMATHANIFYNTYSAIDALGFTEDDVHLCMFAPFAHPHEIFARPLYLGGTAVLMDKLSPKAIARAIEKHGVTCMMAIAPVYEHLLDVFATNDYDFSSLRIPESGGMFTRSELIERFEAVVGRPILPVWGSTETTGIGVANRPGEPQAPGSIGRVCRFYQMKLVDDDGAEVPVGEVGEMAFSGAAVVSGYYGDASQGEACFKDGFYYTGDLAKMDEDGNVYFVERKSGMMKMAGLKVYPLEIEQVLLEHPDIADAVVVSVQHKMRGEIPKAFIVPRADIALTEKDILDYCGGRMASYKFPREIEFRESLPKMGSGKPNRKALQMENHESLSC